MWSTTIERYEEYIAELVNKLVDQGYDRRDAELQAAWSFYRCEDHGDCTWRPVKWQDNRFGQAAREHFPQLISPVSCQVNGEKRMMNRLSFILAVACVLSLTCIIHAQDRGWASSIAWSPDGQTIAVGGGAGVWFFDNHFNEEGFVEIEHPLDNAPRLVEWNAKGDLLSHSSFASSINIIDVTAREVISAIYLHGVSLWTPVLWHPNENLIIGGSYSGTTHIWNAITGEELFHFDSLEVDPDVSWAATLGFCWFAEDEVVIVNGRMTYVANISENAIQESYWFPHTALDSISCNRRYQIISTYGRLYGLQPLSFNQVFDHDHYKGEAENGAELAYAEAVEWSPGSDRFVVSFGDCHIHVYDGESSELVATMPGGVYETLSIGFFMDSIAWSPDGRRFAAVGQFGDIRVWDAETYQLLQRFDGFETHPKFLRRYREPGQLKKIGCP